MALLIWFSNFDETLPIQGNIRSAGHFPGLNIFLLQSWLIFGWGKKVEHLLDICFWWAVKLISKLCQFQYLPQLWLRHLSSIVSLHSLQVGHCAYWVIKQEYILFPTFAKIISAKSISFILIGSTFFALWQSLNCLCSTGCICETISYGSLYSK